MNRILVLLLAVVVGVVFGREFAGVSNTAEAEGGNGAGEAKCAGVNGDVNADGELDISDGITILRHLFRGNPAELVPLCDPPELTARVAELEAQLEATQGELEAYATELEAAQAQLAVSESELAECRSRPFGLPHTGQRMCYDDSGNVVDCASDTCAGQDGYYQIGCPSDGRFVDNGDGTVTDICTGLMWQQGTAVDDYYFWCDALAYCENLELAGHDDWRLPNVRELQSIADYERIEGSGSAIDPVFEAWRTFYWSSTFVPNNPSRAWGVDFNAGRVDTGSKTDDDFYVRAVRNAP